MRRIFNGLAMAVVVSAGLVATDAHAQFGRPRATESTTPVVPRCSQSLGTLTIQNGDTYQGWRQYNFQPPAGLLRVVVQQSGCFTLVERGTGLAAVQREQALAGGGQLQRGSNVGGGQIRAAVYVLLADVVAQDNNSGGGGFGAALGGAVGGTVGGIIGGLGTRTQQATTTLSLMNVRTSETAVVTEGNARNRNITWGGGGFIGGGGAALGGYTDTEIGRVVTVAFIDAYTQMVTQLGGVDTSTSAAAAAPQRTYRTTQATQLRTRAGGGQVMRNLPSGAIVYPTGERDGMWWRVADENDNEGWVNNDFLQPAQ